MAGTAEGVWLDSESIHPFDIDTMNGETLFGDRRSDSAC